MKSFLLIRHAKSSWADSTLEDKKRPLNTRGNRDGPYMASFCRKKGLIPDIIYSSPAIRAKKTAEYFSNEFEEELVESFIESDLYFGSELDWLHLITEVSEKIKLPAFFSHNPGITYFANHFSEGITDNVPTCGIVHIISTSKTWNDVDYKNSKVANLFYPKLVRRENSK